MKTFYSTTEPEYSKHTGWCRIYKGEVTNMSQVRHVINGVLHHDTMPALFCFRTMSQQWFTNGRRNRLDGPATTYFGDSNQCQWWIDHIFFEEKQYWNQPKVIEFKLERILIYDDI